MFMILSRVQSGQNSVKKKKKKKASSTSKSLFFYTLIFLSLTFLSESFFRAAGFWSMHGTNWESLGSTQRMRSMECFWWLLKTKLECPSSLPPSSSTYPHWVRSGGIRESRKPSAVGASISWWVHPSSWGEEKSSLLYKYLFRWKIACYVRDLAIIWAVHSHAVNLSSSAAETSGNWSQTWKTTWQ